MSFLDDLARRLTAQAKQQVRQQVQQTAQRAAAPKTEEWTVTFETLPETPEQLKALPQAALKTPQDTAALTVAALCAFPKDREACFAMLQFLSGPRELTPRDRQFIADRFMDGKDYIPRSYFAGAVPENDYTPSLPYTLRMRRDPYGAAEEGYEGVLLRSGGADSERSVRLRCKPSTGQWFLWQQDLLVGIRTPKSQDAWA